MKSSSHIIWYQDFFYRLLIEDYLNVFDVSNHLFLNRLFYLYAHPLLQMRGCQHWDRKPQLSLYEDMKRWEEERDIVVPEEIRLFYSAWSPELHEIYQRVHVVGGRGYLCEGRIRELVYYHKPQLPENTSPGAPIEIACCDYSSPDYLCIACCEINSVHKDWSVSLLTFIDLKGKKTGRVNAIFDIESVDNLLDVDPILDVLSQIEEEEIGSYQYKGHGYSSFAFGMTARNFFELLTMMPENRFYYNSKPSNDVVCWYRGSGKKS